MIDPVTVGRVVNALESIAKSLKKLEALSMPPMIVNNRHFPPFISGGGGAGAPGPGPDKVTT